MDTSSLTSNEEIQSLWMKSGDSLRDYLWSHSPALYFTLIRKEDGWFLDTGIAHIQNNELIELNSTMVIRANINTKTLIIVNNEDLSGIEHNQLLNLSDEGERWEGDVLNDQPFGWGVLYDNDNNRIYEGFRIGELGVCYGTHYYSDIGVIEYKGELCEGKRWGHGVQYDRNGRVVYDGDWINNEVMEKRIEITEENENTVLLHNRIEELVIGEHCWNYEGLTAVDFKYMPFLRELTVNNHSLDHVREITLSGLQHLERTLFLCSPFSIKGSFCVRDCPVLSSLRIGDGAFVSYVSCVIESNAMLKEIVIGELYDYDESFYHGELVVKGVACWSVLRNRLAQAGNHYAW